MDGDLLNFILAVTNVVVCWRVIDPRQLGYRRAAAGSWAIAAVSSISGTGPLSMLMGFSGIAFTVGAFRAKRRWREGWREG